MASSQYPPKTPPKTHQKRTFPSFSVRRPSASSTTLPASASASSSTLNLSRTSFSTTSITAAVAASPTSPATSTQTAGSGIPASFRSLRNLLPFSGSAKPPNNVQNTPSRSFSVGFGSVRRSMNVLRETDKDRDRNRKFSLSNEALMAPVISIAPKHSVGRDLSQTQSGGDESPPLRRSVSLPRLEGVINLEKPLPEPVQSDLSLRDEIEAGMTLMSLRTPSPPSSPERPPPVPPTRYRHSFHSENIGMNTMGNMATIPPAELSTIIEADNSGMSISKHIPLLTPSSSSESLSSPAREEEHTIRRPVFQHAVSSSSNTTPLVTSSPLKPGTPTRHQHKHHSSHSTSATGIMPTSSASTLAPANTVSFHNNNHSQDGDEDEDELSTSQLASQVQAALARASTSWGGSTDRAFVIDVDTSFIQMHDEEDSVRTPAESETSSFDDDEDERYLEERYADVDLDVDANASVIAIFDAPLDSPSSPSPSLSSDQGQEQARDPEEVDDDETSRINNSTLSIVNPNNLLQVSEAQEDVTFNLSSLDPDLRDAVRGHMQNQQQQETSPMSIRSSSERTVVLPSPTSASALMQQSGAVGVAPGSVSSPTTTTATTPTSAITTTTNTSSKGTPSAVLSPHHQSAKKPSLRPLSLVSTSTFALKATPQPIATTSITTAMATSKRRVASSSFLPRLRSSPPPHSPSSQSFSASSLETKNSNSPQKTTFDVPVTGTGVNVGGGNGSRIPQSSSPRTAVFSLIQVPSIPSSSPSVTNAATKAAAPTTSAPLKYGNQNTRKSFGSISITTGGGQQQQQNGRKSSVPVATWRNSRELSGTGRVASGSSIGTGGVVHVGPEVKIVEASADVDPLTVPANSDSSTTATETRQIQGQERGEAHTWPATRFDAGETEEEDTGRLSVDDYSRRVTGEEGESLILGSPFPDAISTNQRIQSPSPSPVHGPPPSNHYHAHQRRHSHRSTTPTAPVIRDLTITPTTGFGSGLFVPSPSPSPILPPQPLVPSPIIPPSSSGGLNRGGSLRINKGASGGVGIGEDGEEKSVLDGGSLSGRPSRRISAPLRLLWGSLSNGSAAQAGPTTSGGTGTDMPERQPSPLRSILQVDSRGDSDDFGTSHPHHHHHHHHHHAASGRTGTRPSIDDSSSVRPSLESSRPSLDSSAYSSSSYARRESPDPMYQKYVVERERESKPPIRLRDHERERDRDRDRGHDIEHQRDGLVARARKRSMSVQGNSENDHPFTTTSTTNTSTTGNLGVGLVGGSAINLSSAAMSARERLARVRYGDLGGGARPWSSMSMRSNGRAESLHVSRGNNNTTRLSFYDREMSPGIERSVSERATGEQERERSGSVSGIGTLGRYASLRSASEYNFGHTRRESLAGGLMDSPTFTVSTSVSGSGSASGGTTTTTTGGGGGGGTGSSRGDTPRSTSTGATSVSTTTSNTKDRERERDREELRDMKEKHATETGALLNALSDSQRTCRVLREENTELRERLGEVERDNEQLRRVVGELEREVTAIARERDRERERERERVWERRERRDTRSTSTGLSNSVGPGAGGTSWRGLTTPMIKHRDAAMGSRTAVRVSSTNTNKWNIMERDLELEGGIPDVTMMRHIQQRSKLDNVLFSREIQTREPELNVYSDGQGRSRSDDDELFTPVRENSAIHDDDVAPAPEDEAFGSALAPPNNSTNMNPTSMHRRRPSTSSSIFPAPPSNMTMLLHDEMGLLSGLGVESNRSSASLGPSKLPGSPTIPISRGGKLPTAVAHSVASNVSVSPTTENFSMVTGSPGSLFLKPEHEMMLDEMESLDLGRSMSGVVVSED